MILAAVLAVLVYGLISPLLGVLLPTYLLNPVEQGNLALANGLGLLTASISAGPLVDLKGKKVALSFGLSFVALTLICLPAIAGYQRLLAAFFALGAGGGIISTASNSLASDIAPRRRGSALNSLNLFFGLGGIITTLAASYYMTPRLLCYSLVALAMVALLVNLLATAKNERSGPLFKLHEALRLMTNPLLLVMSLLLFLYVACEVGVWIWLKTYLISINLDARTAGGIVSYGFALGILVGRIIASRILMRVEALKVIVASGLLISAATFAMLQLHSQTGVTIAVFCAGMFMAPVFPTVLAMVGDQFPHKASAMGIVITCGWMGLAVSSPVLGRLAADLSLHAALMLIPALAGTLVLVSLVLEKNLRFQLAT